MEKNVFAATGRRKESTARVEIKDGQGTFTVNGHDVLDYLKRQTLVNHAQEPLAKSDLLGRFSIRSSAKGGGLTGQAGALRLAIARALLERDPSMKDKLRENGFLTRDDRMVERKKYGQPKARKRFQYSKR